MDKVKLCGHGRCRARAWHGDLCNRHALAAHRGRQTVVGTAEKLRRGKALLRQRAEQLGIKLDDEPAAQAAVAPVGGTLWKARSPVA